VQHNFGQLKPEAGDAFFPLLNIANDRVNQRWFAFESDNQTPFPGQIVTFDFGSGFVSHTLAAFCLSHEKGAFSVLFLFSN
jgi:hypothetical protein